jgi:hypothetical protein
MWLADGCDGDNLQYEMKSDEDIIGMHKKSLAIKWVQ